MSHEIIVRPEADREIQESFHWYAERSPNLGFEFLDAVDACLNAIDQMPLAFPIVHQTIRRSLLHRFPYAIFYIIEDNRIVVLACFHAKRNPSEWKRRE